MTPNDYRKAACCGNCYNLCMQVMICSKYGATVDMFHVCAQFLPDTEVEDEA